MMTRLFCQKFKTAQELAELLGDSLPNTLLLFLELDAAGFGACSLWIYHCQDKPVLNIPFGQGFPTLHWHCPICGQEIKDLTQLMFEIGIVPINELSTIATNC